MSLFSTDLQHRLPAVNSVAGDLTQAICETASAVQTTQIIAQSSVLACLSTAISPNADWVHPATGQVRPCSLYMCMIAPSGERKSSTDTLVFKPVYVHDETALLRHKADLEEFKTKNDQWTAINDGLRMRLAKHAKGGKSTSAIQADLDEHAQRKPIKPELVRLVRQDISHRAVAEALQGNGMAIALHTDEGQTLLDGNVMKHLGALNTLWDGKQLQTYDRGNGSSIIMQNPRVTLNLMVQPIVMGEYLSKNGRLAQGSGHFARYLIARSPSVQGYRSQTSGDFPLVHLPAFHERIASLIEAYATMAKANRIVRDVLEFDGEAKAVWFDIATRVENDIKPGFYLSDINDFASKYLEQVGRIACLLHFYAADSEIHLDETPESRKRRIGKITATTLRQAENIASLYLHEFKAIFAPPPLPPQEAVDAQSLYTYLYRVRYLSFLNRAQMGDPNAQQSLWPTKNHVRQNCGLRGKGGRFDRALALLIQQGVLSTQSFLLGASRKPTEMIGLNQQYFQDNPTY